MDAYEIVELRKRLKDYHGTAAVTLGNDAAFGYIPPLSELYETDDLSDEEVIEEAKRLGIL